MHVCVRIRRHRRVEKIVWEVHMKCSSALRLYVLLMEIGAIGHHGPNARRHVGVETRSDHVTVVTRRPPMEENPVLEIQHSHRHAQTQHVLLAPSVHLAMRI